jgi:hypothetical protein
MSSVWVRTHIEVNFHGQHDSYRYSCSYSPWRIAQLGAQPKLGIWAVRWSWPAVGYLCRSYADGQDMNEINMLAETCNHLEDAGRHVLSVA